MHWATIITSTGALLGGLAIVMAFFQFGRQREDRLRAQVGKIGVWAEAEELREHPDKPAWQITLFIQNASELPVEVQLARLAIDTLGYKDVLASVGGEPPQLYADKRTGPVRLVHFLREQSRLGANGMASTSTPRTATSTPLCRPGSASFS